MDKNLLQEYYQKRQLPLPQYNTLCVGGPSHAPEFQSTVVLADGLKVQGQICNSKKEAEASAARQALHSSRTMQRQNQEGFIPASSTVPMSTSYHPPTNSNFVQVPSLSTVADSSMVRSFTKHTPIPVKVAPSSAVFYPPPQRFVPTNPQSSSREPAARRLVSPLPQKLLSPADLSNIEQERPRKNKTVILVDVENMPRLAEQVATTHPEIDVYAFVGEHHGLSEKDFGPGVTKILTPGSQINGSDACLIMYTTVFLMEKKYRTYYIGTRDKFGSALVELISNRDSAMPWTYRSAKLITNVNQL